MAFAYGRTRVYPIRRISLDLTFLSILEVKDEAIGKRHLMNCRDGFFPFFVLSRCIRRRRISFGR